MQRNGESLIREAELVIKKYHNYINNQTHKKEINKETKKTPEKEDIEGLLYKEVEEYPLLRDKDVFDSLYIVYKKIKNYLISEKIDSEKLKNYMYNIRDKLLIPNIRHVRIKAREYKRKYKKFGIELDDLVNEGSIGLMKAFEKYDPKRGVFFINYADSWIGQTMQRAIADKSKLIKIPVNKLQKIMKINKLRGILETELEREATDEELSDFINIPIQKINEMEDYYKRRILSLDNIISEDGESLSDFMSDEKYEFEKRIDAQFLTEKLLEILKKQEKDILYRYIGEDEGLRSIGEDYNLTRERIRQKKEKALIKVRNHYKKLEKLGSVGMLKKN